MYTCSFQSKEESLKESDDNVAKEKNLAVELDKAKEEVVKTKNGMNGKIFSYKISVVFEQYNCSYRYSNSVTLKEEISLSQMKNY